MVTYPKSPGEAFKNCKTYRPQIWGIGSMPFTPMENGVELEDGYLVLYEYRNHQVANKIPWTTKHEIARKPALQEQRDKFRTEYQVVRQ